MCQTKQLFLHRTPKADLLIQSVVKGAWPRYLVPSGRGSQTPGGWGVTPVQRDEKQTVASLSRDTINGRLRSQEPALMFTLARKFYCGQLGSDLHGNKAHPPPVATPGANQRED